MKKTIKTLDEKAIFWMLHHQQTFLQKFFKLFTQFASAKAWALLTGALLILKMSTLENHSMLNLSLNALKSAFVAWLISDLLKIIFKRPRPSSNILTEKTYSFPSTHAATAIALATSMSHFIGNQHPIELFILWSWAILIIVSRFYCCVHYISDLIFGSVVGFIAAWICIHFF